MDLRYPDPGHKSCGRADDELGGRGHHTNQWLLPLYQKIDGSSSRQDREGARGRLGAARKRESSFSPTIA